MGEESVPAARGLARQFVDVVTQGEERALKVLVVGLNYSPEPTGIAPYTTAFCRGLLARGHRVRVLTAMPHYPEWRIREGYRSWSMREMVDGVQLTRLRHYVPVNPTVVRRLLSEITFGIRVAFSKWGRPDVVVFVSPALISSAIAILVRVPRQPYVLWVQDLYSSGLRETRGPKAGGAVGAVGKLEGFLLRKATGVAVIHQRFAEAVARLGAAPDRTAVVRNWTHLPPRSHLDTRRPTQLLGARDGTISAVHSGAIGRKQDLDNLVEAARIAHVEKRPVRFVIVGNGSERSRLELAAAGLPTIVFMDPLPEELFQQVLSSADVLLVNEHPGLREMAVPSKLTSYFASGRPIVAATDVDSVTAEEIRASAAGVRVDPGRPDLLLEAVIRLGNDIDKATVFGEAGRRYQRTVLSEASALDGFTSWLESMLRGNRRLTIGERFRLRRDSH